MPLRQPAAARAAGCVQQEQVDDFFATATASPQQLHKQLQNINAALKRRLRDSVDDLFDVDLPAEPSTHACKSQQHGSSDGSQQRGVQAGHQLSDAVTVLADATSSDNVHPLFTQPSRKRKQPTVSGHLSASVSPEQTLHAAASELVDAQVLQQLIESTISNDTNSVNASADALLAQRQREQRNVAIRGSHTQTPDASLDLQYQSDRLRGPGISDHMRDKKRWPGYYEQRTEALNELRPNAIVYAEMLQKTMGIVYPLQSVDQMKADSSSALREDAIAEPAFPQIFAGLSFYLNGRMAVRLDGDDDRRQRQRATAPSTPSRWSDANGCRTDADPAYAVNDATVPELSALDLTNLLKLHGGRVLLTAARRQLTHVVADTLSNTKFSSEISLRTNSRSYQAQSLYFVQPQWVVECLQRGHRVQESEYRLVVDRFNSELRTHLLKAATTDNAAMTGGGIKLDAAVNADAV